MTERCRCVDYGDALRGLVAFLFEATTGLPRPVCGTEAVWRANAVWGTREGSFRELDLEPGADSSKAGHRSFRPAGNRPAAVRIC